MTNTNRDDMVRERREVVGYLRRMGTVGGNRAATLIETQGREIERYREALTPFAALDIAHLGLNPQRPLWATNDTVLYLGDILRARQALQSPTQAPLQESELDRQLRETDVDDNHTEDLATQ